jgi:YcxB-like protein
MAQSNPEITITFMLTEKDLIRLTWTALLRKKSIVVPAILLGIMFLVIIPCFGLSTLMSGDPSQLALLPGLLFVPFLIFVVVPLTINWGARKTFRNTPAARQETTYVISEEGIHSRNDLVRSEVKWGSVIEVLETKRDFLLFISNQAAFMLPKDALPTPEERRRLRRLIKDNACDRVSLLRERTESE